MQDKIQEALVTTQELIDRYVESINESINESNGKVPAGNINYATGKLIQRTAVDAYTSRAHPEVIESIYKDTVVKRLLGELLRMFILGYRMEWNYTMEKLVKVKITEHPMISLHNPWISPDNAAEQLNTLEKCIEYLKEYPMWYSIDKITVYIEADNNVVRQTVDVCLALRIIARNITV